MSELIDIEVKLDRPDMWRSPNCAPTKHIRKSLPFVENRRGILIHRVRHIEQHQLKGDPVHLAVTMWCGNTQCGDKKFTFLQDPPREKMVCQRCEDAALEAGKSGSGELARRPVTIGRLQAVGTRISYPNKKALESDEN